MDTATTPSISEILAGQLADINAATPGEREDRAFNRACTDFITCALLGASMPVTDAARRYVSRTDTGQHAALIGRRERLSPAGAAFVNAAATHGLDFDDGHTQAGGHPGASVFPTAFAVGEEVGADADDIVRAVIAGYHAMVRVARMMHPRTARRGWHNTAVAGTFGATATAASLMKLDIGKTVHAFGLAGSFTGGLLEFLAEGPDVKRLHPGMAARDGIACAGLAAEGLTGPRHVFEGRHGVFNAFIDGEADTGPLASDDLEIEKAYFKLYPCCRHYHAAIDGLIGLRDEHGLDLSNVRAVHLGLYGVAVRGHDHREADTMLGAQMSAPIAAGLALTDGAVTVQGFQRDSLERPEVRAAVGRVDVTVDDVCEREYPKRRSGAVAIELTDGSLLERRVHDPRGEGANPLSDADLQAKFRTNCEPILGRDTAESVLALVWNFRREPSALDRLIGALTPED